MTPDVTANSRYRLALVLLWITPLLWSSNYIIARSASGVIAPHMLALCRWSLAFVLMLPWVWADAAHVWREWRRQWVHMVVLGGLGMWICGAFVYIGAQSTSATNIGLIYAVAPVGIALVSRWLLRETVSGMQKLGMILALVGVLFVISKGDLGSLLGVRFVRGDLWIVAASVAWVAYSVLFQYWPSTLDPRQRLACIALGGLIMLVPFTVLETMTVPQPAWSAEALLLIAIAGVVPGYLAYQAYGFMLRELGSTRAALVMYLGPIYAAFTAWWILGETPQWYHLVGAALILPSIWLATRGGRRAVLTPGEQ